MKQQSLHKLMNTPAKLTCMTAALALIGLGMTSGQAQAGNRDFLGGLATGVIVKSIIDGASNSQRSRPAPRAYRPRTRPSRRRINRGNVIVAPVLPRVNRRIVNIQRALLHLGYFTGRTSGAMDSLTRTGISNYQRGKNIPVTGVLNDEQRNLLLAESEHQVRLVTLGDPGGIVSNRRANIKRDQVALKALGFYTARVDGKSGPGTRRSISAFQASANLPATGVLSASDRVELISRARTQITQRVVAINAQYNGGTGSPVITASTKPMQANLVPQPAANPKPALQQTGANLPPLAKIVNTGTPKRPNDIAVIIGNTKYQNDIPDVAYGQRDAHGIKAVLVNTLGFDESNIIDARDASQGKMMAIFGTATNHKGLLWRFINPDGISNVYVYYSGHGVPEIASKTPYLLPVDADPNALGINGYPLSLLYGNLDKLNIKSATVMIEACFSGGSQKGMLIQHASPVMVSVKTPDTALSKKITVLAAAQGNQLASWNEKQGYGIFTYRLMEGLKGAADLNGDRKITAGELHKFTTKTVRRDARRAYGREQMPTLLGNPDRVIATF